MIETEHLHRHSETASSCTSKLNAIMNPLVLSTYGTVPDNYSLSSASTSTAENSLKKNLKTVNQSDSVCNSSSVGDTSSAASSIDFFCFSPTKGGEKTQTPDQGISLTTSSSSVPGSLSRPTTTPTSSTINAEIDEFMLSMLNTAKELSTFSANDCSRSSSTSVMSKSLQTKFEKREEEEEEHLPPQFSTTTLSLKCETPLQEGSTSPDLSSSTKISIDELSNLSEVDSLIKELDEAPSTHCNRPQGGTPKFLQMDDQYTTNNYVSIVRDIAEKQTKKRNKNEALIRTSSWAANLATNPPPLPVTSVPSTPIMSKYRIMNSSMKISPDNNFERNDTPTSTKSAVNDGYFFHYEDSGNPRISGVQKKFTNFASKIVNGQRFKPMSLTMNHPTLNNSEASLTRSDISERQVARVGGNGGALVMRNAAFDANATFPFNQRHYDPPFSNRVHQKSSIRVDEILEHDSDFLYDVQSADKLHTIHELALQELSHFVERSVSLRIKQWGMNFDVIRNIRNKFVRPQPSEKYLSKKLFGMPLYLVQAKTGNGNPFPKFVMDIMDYMKVNALKIDGIFRRCGSKLRIAEMRKFCDDLSVHDSLPEEFKSLSQVNDLSDLLKQYLRELPHKLVPESISELVTCAISANPSDKHLDIMKLVVCIMPDEHRDALLIFLDFLLSISKHSSQNLMTVDNLSICTLPTIFTLCDVSQRSTPNLRRKTVAVMNDKSTIQYKALKEALSTLISYRSELDTIPPHLLKAANMKQFQRKKKKDLKNAMPPIEEIGAAASLHQFVANLFKESDELWKAWHIEFIADNGIVFATREVDDSCALKSFRLQLTVPASPKHVVSALLNHREKWDLTTTSTKTTFIDVAHKEDIAHITFNNFNSASIKKATVARIWEDGEAGSGNAYVAEKSCKNDPSCINVEVYHSAFIIVPYKGKSIINYISRIDLKGKSTEWYEKTYTHLLISQMTRLAYLFKNMLD